MTRAALNGDARDGTSKDLILAELLERVDECRRNGQSVDYQTIARDHPGMAADLRALHETADDVRRLIGRDWTGRRLGDYQIIKLVGLGGMGVVYEATHVKMEGSRFAVKVIRPDRAKCLSTATRFRIESNIGRGLKHDHIMEVLDLGDHEGTPYFVMPFNDGMTMRKLIEQLRELQSGRSGSLPDGFVHWSSDPGKNVRLAAELGRQAAEALHYIHRQGVVHRDIKPDNLHIGLGGDVRLSDFGLARQSEPAGNPLTQQGFSPGTPDYMSPEQRKSKGATASSDIYSLGASLYELLALRIAPPGQALRTAAPWVPPDLARIIDRAMKKSPLSRYPTAEAMSDDLQRFLDGKPVRARGPGLATRLKRLAEADPRLAFISTLLVFLLVLISAVSTWQAFRATRAETRVREEQGNTKAALAQAKQQRARAEAREQLAIDAVKNFRNAVQANPELKNRPELDALRKALLKEPLEFFRKLRDQLRADRDTRPEAEAELAGAYFDLADTTAEIGSVPDAIRSYSESIAIYERLVKDHPAITDYQSRLALSHEAIGNLLSATGQTAEALESHREALAIRERLVEDHPTVTDYWSGLAASHHNLSNLLSATGQAAEALESHREALAIRERLAREHPTVTEFQSRLADSHYNIACARALQAGTAIDPAEAKKWTDDAMAALRRADAAGWSDWEHTAQDEDLKALRGRSDFQELLRERRKPKPTAGLSTSG